MRTRARLIQNLAHLRLATLFATPDSSISRHDNNCDESGILLLAPFVGPCRCVVRQNRCGEQRCPSASERDFDKSGPGPHPPVKVRVGCIIEKKNPYGRIDARQYFESGRRSAGEHGELCWLMGKGIALPVQKGLPANYEAYHKACDNGEVQPGRMFIFGLESMLNPNMSSTFHKA